MNLIPPPVYIEKAEWWTVKCLDCDHGAIISITLENGKPARPKFCIECGSENLITTLWARLPMESV